MTNQREQEIKELENSLANLCANVDETDCTHNGKLDIGSDECQKCFAKSLYSIGYRNINNIKLTAIIKSRGRYYKQGEGRPDEKVFGYEEDGELYESSGYLVFLTDKDLAQLAHNLRELGK